jgi:hypothetical protein
VEANCQDEKMLQGGAIVSNRNGTWKLFKKDIDDTTAEVMVEGHPDAIQQHGKFSRHGDDGTILGIACLRVMPGSDPTVAGLNPFRVARGRDWHTPPAGCGGRRCLLW